MRITEPVMHFNKNIIDVNFEVYLTDKISGKTSKINETHSMRYFFLPELEHYLKEAELRIEKEYRWLSKESLNSDAWYGIIVAKKD